MDSTTPPDAQAKKPNNTKAVLMPSLSMAKYKPDVAITKRALGMQEEQHDNQYSMSKFEQPKFGR